ncbi:PepSY domain-containing protein [Deferribacteraceae bacterium V6Fe1]|nr:PepSY domain-containing protein [Deferribacteraceae bacterium V6Fe1]
MKKALTAILVAGALVVGAGSLKSAKADSEDGKTLNGTIKISRVQESDYPFMANISMAEAIQYAKKSNSGGKILKAELEEENGFLVYDVEVVQKNGDTVKLSIDAGNGKVLNIKKDKSDSDHEHDDENDDEENDNEKDS